MSNEQISELINAIVDDNSVESEKVFNSIMADKVADRLQDYRKEVASTYFNQTEVEETHEDATE